MKQEDDLHNLAEEVRNEQWNHSTSTRKPLSYNPETGDFVLGGNGDVVTEMTKGGFASERAEAETLNPTIYISSDGIRRFLESGAEFKSDVACRTWPEENVIQILNCSPKEIKEGILTYCSMGNTKNRLADESPSESGLAVLCENNSVEVYRKSSDGLEGPLDYQVIPGKEDLYSRSKGILEVDVLETKRVMIIGLGSFGSQIAIELAKAGVGQFAIADFDRVELHNLMRHTATVSDLGRLKTDVIEESILGKNPFAQVDKLQMDITKNRDLLKEEIGKADLVICATDNNASRYVISKALVEKEKVGIFGRAITRAEGGDVFIYRPGDACYCCLIGANDLLPEEITNEASARRDGRIADYVSPEDADMMVQVGLSSDIAPICNMMVKLALVELSRGTDSGLNILEDELVYNYYLWANRREKHFTNWKALPEPGQKPTILRWYGARIPKEDNCPICSGNFSLD